MKHLALALILLASPVAAQSDLRPQDAARLDGFAKTAGRAILQAMSGGTPSDVAALTQALSGKADIAFDESLIGDWKCRTLKLGGPADLTVYTTFACRFSVGATGFDFEKLTGSERTKGTITLRAGRAIYVGVGYGADETAPAYADLPPDFAPNENIQTQIAVFERVNKTRARLMFPSPTTESDFDILELTR